MRYGVERKTITLDENGSTVTTEKKIVDFKISKPIRNYYEERVKVKDKKDEMTEYLKFTDSITDNMKDAAFRLEQSDHGKENGYYYVIKCWTELSYE